MASVGTSHVAVYACVLIKINSRSLQWAAFHINILYWIHAASAFFRCHYGILIGSSGLNIIYNLSIADIMLIRSGGAASIERSGVSGNESSHVELTVY